MRIIGSIVVAAHAVICPIAIAQTAAPFTKPAAFNAWVGEARTANLPFIKAEAAMLTKAGRPDPGVEISTVGSVTVKPGAFVAGPIIVVTEIAALPTIEALRSTRK